MADGYQKPNGPNRKALANREGLPEAREKPFDTARREVPHCMIITEIRGNPSN